MTYSNTKSDFKHCILHCTFLKTFLFYYFPFPRLCSTHSSLRTKGLAGKSTRIPTSTQVVGSIWGQQPEQVDRVFQALQKGLKYALIIFCYTHTHCHCYCSHCPAIILRILIVSNYYGLFSEVY